MSNIRPLASGSDLPARLREMIDRRQTGAARPLLNAVLRLLPPGEAIADMEARLLLLEGNAAAACAVLDTALARLPDSAVLRLSRAVARGHAGDTEGAMRDAADAVVLDPSQPRAKALLGAFLNGLGRHAEARACLAEAVAAVPDDGFNRRHLAAALSALGDETGAAAVLDEGLARVPEDVALRVAAILSRLRQDDFAGAEGLALAALRRGVADACVFGLLGHARSSLGRHDDAAWAYAEARKLAPEDPYVRHLAAAGGMAADAGRASADYVRTVFDGYAARFDSHLIALGYRVPGLIRAELARLPRLAAAGPVLDLGCGTGLLAVAAADQGVGPWVGVDLSPAMLAEARKHGLYAELREADIAHFLRADGRAFPLIVAGDAMPYFGDLAPLLRLVAARLAPGGRFVFSTEHLPADGDAPPAWRLGRLGRYAHGDAHVAAAAAAAGLVAVSVRAEPVRLEGGMPVPGLIVTLERPDP